MSFFKINNFKITQNTDPFFVAEIGINFEGSLEIAKKTILAAKKAGADSVKFQYYKTDDFISNKKLLLKTKNNKSTKISQYDLFKKNELNFNQIRELKEFSDKNRILFHATPTNEKAVNELIELGCKVIKNGSDFLTNFKILKTIAKKKVPVILSTGMCTKKEIEFALNYFSKYKKNNIIILHCVSNYPTKIEDANIDRILKLRKNYKILTGYSDHTIGFNSAVIARVLGAVWFEKHFTLNKKFLGPDHFFSCDQKDFQDYILNVKNVDKTLGSGKIDLDKEQQVARNQFGVSCFSNKEILANKRVNLHDINFLRPGNGITPVDAHKILGKVAKKNIKKLTKLKFNLFKN